MQCIDLVGCKNSFWVAKQLVHGAGGEVRWRGTECRGVSSFSVWLLIALSCKVALLLMHINSIRHILAPQAVVKVLSKII